jgi:cbb3-type cytochrome oxidase subunit 3
MRWWLWPLIYVAGWMFTFRTVYLREREATQRAVARGRHKELARRWGNPAGSYVADWETKDRMVTWFASMWWPFFCLYLLGKFIMFPRGVKTKFDREQQLEREKQEAQRKYQEAKELLAQEGITVE